MGTPLLSVRRTPEWLTGPVSKARLANAFGAALEQPVLPEKTCLVVYRNDELVYEVLGGEPLIPASLMKIATASAFLESVGPDFRYATGVFVRSDALDAAQAAGNGVLRGDLYLIGAGDPVLSTPDYIARYPQSRSHTDITALADATAGALRERGIADIRGRVIGDESYYLDAERDYTGVRPDGSG